MTVFTIVDILLFYLSVICLQTELVLKPVITAFGSGQNEPPPHPISTIIPAAVINQDNKARYHVDGTKAKIQVAVERMTRNRLLLGGGGGSERIGVHSFPGLNFVKC